MTATDLLALASDLAAAGLPHRTVTGDRLTFDYVDESYTAITVPHPTRPGWGWHLAGGMDSPVYEALERAWSRVLCAAKGVEFVPAAPNPSMGSTEEQKFRWACR